MQTTGIYVRVRQQDSNLYDNLDLSELTDQQLALVLANWASEPDRGARWLINTVFICLGRDPFFSDDGPVTLRPPE